jgi:hypothetical protein
VFLHTESRVLDGFEGFMKKLVAVAALSFAAWGVHAGTTMFGIPDCGKWMAIHSESQKGWLLGFVSGLASMDTIPDVLDSVASAEQMYLWVNNYCQAHPLNGLNDAGNSLYLELTLKRAVKSGH